MVMTMKLTAALALSVALYGNVMQEASAAAATCSIHPTMRDVANKLNVLNDPNCVFAGRGCVTPQCRYCRLTDSIQFAHLLLCSDVTDFTFAPVDVIDDPPPPAFVLQCASSVSTGDAAVGIDLVTDISCVLGGVGCTSDVCRYCRRNTTVQSANFMACSAVSTNNGDDIGFVPILPLWVPANVSGFVIGSMTRPVLDQINITALATPTPTPTPTPSIPLTTAPPTTSPPVAATATPTTPPPTTTTTMPTAPSLSDPCAASVALGDVNVGISAYMDASCASGGLGCFSATCRFCKLFDSIQSQQFLPCSTATPAPSTPTPAPTTAAPTTPAPTIPAPTTPAPTTPAPAMPVPTTPAPTTPAPTTPAPTTPAPTTPAPTTPAPTTRAPTTPAPTTPAPTTRTPTTPTPPTPAPTTRAPTTAPTTTPTPTTTKPPTTPPPTTPAPTTRTPTPTTPVPTTRAPTPVPTTPTPTTTAPTAPSISGDACAATVATGDLAVGISAFTDSACVSGGLGCFSSTCRYCKLFDTIQSQHLMVCKVVDTCPQSVSSGDAAVGISAFRDTACASGGLGCFSTTCRFCKTRDTIQSQSFTSCT